MGFSVTATEHGATKKQTSSFLNFMKDSKKERRKLIDTRHERSWVCEWRRILTAMAVHFSKPD